MRRRVGVYYESSMPPEFWTVLVLAIIVGIFLWCYGRRVLWRDPLPSSSPMLSASEVLLGRR